MTWEAASILLQRFLKRLLDFFVSFFVSNYFISIYSGNSHCHPSRFAGAYCLPASTCRTKWNSVWPFKIPFNDLWRR